MASSVGAQSTRELPESARPAFAPDAYVDSLLRQLVLDGRTTGVAVGLLDADGSHRLFAHGFAGDGARGLDGESVFEIGSVTKVFTGVLLAEMVRRGEVKLSDPASRCLPAHVSMPARSGKEITLLDLATHRSGLPVLPENMPARDPRDPYADYSDSLMYEFLAHHELARDPGEAFEYSNLGMGLLGDLLGRCAGMSYEELLRSRILAPLGLSSTAVGSTPAMAARRVHGHDRGGYGWPQWNWSALHGAGALQSTVTDLLRFARAHFVEGSTPLHAALRDAVRIHRHIAESASGSGLGWGVGREGRLDFAAHQGRTYGFSSELVLDLTQRRAVVVLANSYSNGTDGLAAHLLDNSIPMPKPSAGVAVATAYRIAGVDAAFRRYRMLRDSQPDRWTFGVVALNTVGGWLLERGAVNDAVAVFRLNVEEYPGAPVAHNRLGDALRAAGRLEEAFPHYARAVALAEQSGSEEVSRYRADLQRALRELGREPMPRAQPQTPPGDASSSDPSSEARSQPALV